MAPAVWSELRDQSLFITGGTGFVGKWLLESLLHANRELKLGLKLTVLTRDPQSFIRLSPHLAAGQSVELIQGDIEDFAFPAGKFTSVVHAALPVAESRKSTNRLKSLAEKGALRCCKFAVACGARRLLHISSGAVYGAGGVHPFSENCSWSDDADGTANEYTQAKRSAERIVMQEWPFEVVVARCFAFTGPYLLASSGSAAATFMEQAARGEGIVIESTGTAVRTYQYASDMARWLLTALALGSPGLSYNIGSDVLVTISELARRVARLADNRIPVQVTGRVTSSLAGAMYAPIVRRAADELGLDNAVDLDEGIRRTLSWQASAQHFSTVQT